MYISPTIIKRPGVNSRRGSVALAAIVALVVVFIIGLGLLALGSNARLAGKRTLRVNAAQALATAGVEYGCWQYLYNGQPLPYTNSRTLGNGQISVTVTDNSANIAGTIQVVSTGTQSGDSVKLTRVVPIVKKVFDYALCSNSSVNIPPKVVTGASSANGDVRVNGSLTLPNLMTVINGNATATGLIVALGTTGTTTAGGAAITFPTITSSYYQGIATTVYSGNQTFSSLSFPAASGVYYPVIVVNGNLTINTGTTTGVGTVLVTGNLTFNGSFSYLYSTDHVAFLCLGNVIDGASAGTSITDVGYIYAHNTSSNATFQQANAGTMTISGGIAADAFNVTGPLVTKHDPAMNCGLGSKMRLPGY